MKFCKDCKHAVERLHMYNEPYYECDRLNEANPVNGEKTLLSCEVERGLIPTAFFSGNYCGLTGKFWEPKETENT